jgi:hypothetical protein
MSDFDLIYDGVKENYGVFPSQIIEYLDNLADKTTDKQVSNNYAYEAVLFDTLLDIVTGSINPMKKFVEMLDKYSKLAKDSTTRE